MGNTAGSVRPGMRPVTRPVARPVEQPRDRRVRELARDALSVMVFSVLASGALACGVVTLSRLVS